jgi:hypothetical protein
MKLKHLITSAIIVLACQQTILAADIPFLPKQTAVSSTNSEAEFRLTRPSEVDPKIYGKTIGNWGHAWWSWAFNVPKATNPLFKNGAMDCSVGQQGKVWFLAGNFGETSQRSCTIPKSKALFFPVYNSIWWTPAPGTDYGCENEKSCRRDVGSFSSKLRSYTCTIDKQDCAWKYSIVRAQSDNLPFTINTDSILVTEYEEIPGTRTISISDGYWVMLPPLKVGQHKIHFTAATTDEFALDVTYNLTVQ